MNALPRLTYIISSIPLQIPQYWFKEINTIFSQFIWKDKKPRINHKKLSMPRRTGGLGVPNLYLYYLSYNARFPIVWGYGATPKKANWDWLEGQIITENNKSISLNSLWYSPKSNLNNPLIQFSISVVKSVQRRLGITGISLPSCPLWKNPIFTAGGNPLNNIHMQAHDIQHIGQIVKNNIITPFTVLMEHFNLNKSLFLSYMQLQSNIKNLTSKGIKIGCHEHLDMNLKRLANKKGMISGIYKLLLTSTANTNLQSQKRWEQDLGITLTPVEWDRIWSNSTSICKCVRFRVIQ